MGVWVSRAEADDERRAGEREEPPEAEQGGDVDESLPMRRLRHWLKGMFGGTPKPPPEEPPQS